MAVEFEALSPLTFPADVTLSRFSGADGVDEFHLMVRPQASVDVGQQLVWIEAAYREALASIGTEPGTAVFRRFFCSDLHNQAGALEHAACSRRLSAEQPCAISWVGQPPAPPAKVGMWAYHVQDRRGPLEKLQRGSTLSLVRGKLVHHWTTGLTCTAGGTSAEQTRGILQQYESMLHDRGLRMADHLVRTWLFVRNIDSDYAGLVTARREFFASCGLTPQTHFVASSGIQGSAADPGAKVSLDAYAISNLTCEQVRYLTAPDHLCPTHMYGVTFERGTTIAYRDRKHIYLSGTASIDAKGDILHVGDVSRQLDRTLENMEALLAAGGATLRDMCHFIVYVRDPADYDLAVLRMRERFPATPTIVVAAAVCRPGWLIELEGMAVVPAINPELPSF